MWMHLQQTTISWYLPEYDKTFLCLYFQTEIVMYMIYGSLVYAYTVNNHNTCSQTLLKMDIFLSFSNS